MQVCNKCVLNENYPGISFLEDGSCNYCKKAVEDNNNEILTFDENFKEIIGNVKQKKSYDCLLCYSGGKDSTYTLYLLKEKYKLNVLTYTFDNGFLSDYAKGNIQKVTSNLNVDNITFRSRFDVMKNLFRACILPNDFFSLAALKRASAICNTCINFVKYNSLKLALEQKIPMIVFGWDPGQISKKSAIIKLPPDFILASQKTFTDKLVGVVGDDIYNYFVTKDEMEHYSSDVPFYVNPLYFNDYNMDRINKVLNKLGWEKPSDTDANSTNCLLNSLANYFHEKQYGYNPYIQDVSQLIRKGMISREVALNKMKNGYCLAMVSANAEKLGVKELL